MTHPSRRGFVLTAAAAAALRTPLVHALDSATGDGAASPSLREMIRHPLLTHSLYHLPVSRDYSEDAPREPIGRVIDGSKSNARALSGSCGAWRWGGPIGSS